MSRSHRRVPIFSISQSGLRKGEKQEKRTASRRLRRTVRQLLAVDADVLPDTRELDNNYTWTKDGKTYWPEAVGSKKRMGK